MIFKPLKKKKKFGLKQTSTPSQSPTVKESTCKKNYVSTTSTFILILNIIYIRSGYWIFLIFHLFLFVKLCTMFVLHTVHSSEIRGSEKKAN